MAVVINEFDVAAEPPPDKPAARGPAPAQKPEVDARALAQLTRTCAERARRVRAH